MDVHIRPSTNNKLKADLAVVFPKFAKISPKRLTRTGRPLLIQPPSRADAAIHSVTAERALWTPNFPRHAFSLGEIFSGHHVLFVAGRNPVKNCLTNAGHLFNPRSVVEVFQAGIRVRAAVHFVVAEVEHMPAVYSPQRFAHARI